MPSDPAKVEPSPREELLTLVSIWQDMGTDYELRRAYRALEEFVAGEDTDHEFLCIKALQILRGER